MQGKKRLMEVKLYFPFEYEVPLTQSPNLPPSIHATVKLFFINLC